MIASGETAASIGSRLTGIALDRSNDRGWWIAFAAALALLSSFPVSLVGTLLGEAGQRHEARPAVSVLDIASYDWWIGIGAGSLLVAGILLLSGAEWRCAVNRIAETVAVLATLAAALYPVVHLGQPWSLQGTLPGSGAAVPYPQFRAPVIWDATDDIAFLVLTVSLWFVGLLPDLAAQRDRAFEAARAVPAEDVLRRNRILRRARFYRAFAAGWRGSATQWQNWMQAYRTIALLGCLLVVCVQTGAAVMLSGWHDTMLPVTFLVGAVLSGVGVTAAIVVAVRGRYGLDALITERHLDILARLLLVLGLVSFYCHAAEIFATLLLGDAPARAALAGRIAGPHAWAAWSFVLCAILPVQIFWLAEARRSAPLLGLVGMLAAAGIFADHVTMVVASSTYDGQPVSTQLSAIDFRDGLTVLGSIGLFLFLLLLFVRFLPIVSITETRSLVPFNDGEPVDSPDSTEADRNRSDVPLRGIGAVFASQAALLAAARRLEAPDSHVRLDAYGPVPMPDTAAMIGAPQRPIGAYALVGAGVGGTVLLALCVWSALFLDQPDVGGRSSVFWPSFVIPFFAAAMLGGTLAIHLAAFVLDRRSRRQRPVSNIAGFARTTHDRFVLSAEAQDERFDAERLVRRLMRLPADADRPLAIMWMPRADRSGSDALP